MKLRGYVKDVVISLAAGILLEAVILPTITSADHTPEPIPFEINLDLSFSMEVKEMK